MSWRNDQPEKVPMRKYVPRLEKQREVLELVAHLIPKSDRSSKTKEQKAELSLQRKRVRAASAHASLASHHQCKKG